MTNVTLQQLLTLDAVITQGSIQAGADYLNRTHPSVITALKKLEDELGFALFDRSGYRTVLTEQGQLYYRRSKRLLDEMRALEEQAATIRKGDTVELNIILGDVTPIADALKVLRDFSGQHGDVRLNLFFENLAGPNERLLTGEVDFIIHHIDKANPNYEYKDICQVPIVPVIAPGFLDIPVTRDVRYSDLRDATQCIIRDSARGDANKSYFVLPDAPCITVSDQYTKKEIIMQGMAWGHMPLFLVREDLRNGRLLTIQGDYIKGSVVEIVIARLSARQYGVMAEQLWQRF